MRKNTYIENTDGVCVITEKSEYILIDKEDLEVIKPYYWFVQNKQAYTRIGKKTIGLGRFILHIEDPKRKVLRKNNKTLDYRKDNLFSGNTYVLKDGYYEGTCYDGKKFLIDFEDYELISKYVWHVDKNGYVITKFNNESIKQHRMILGLGKADTREVDHIHHNMLDNRKSQLRIVNRSQNCINTRLNINNSSGAKGVYQQKEGFWIAQISYSGKRYYLGCYKNKSDAIRARKNAEQIYHKGYISQE